MELRDDDVLTVLHTLEYDRAVDCGPGLGEDDEDVFRETQLPVPAHHAATSLPCGVCPARTLLPFIALLSPHTFVSRQRLNHFHSTACPVETHAALSAPQAHLCGQAKLLNHSAFACSICQNSLFKSRKGH